MNRLKDIEKSKLISYLLTLQSSVQWIRKTRYCIIDTLSVTLEYCNVIRPFLVPGTCLACSGNNA